MLKKLKHPKYTAILSLVLVFALSIAWATTKHYSSSVVVPKGRALGLTIVPHGRDRINLYSQRGAIDDYMNEQGVNSVEITAELQEVLVDDGNGNSHYELTFTFGPSGAYFNPPIQLDIRGKYVSDATMVELYDENGEAISGTRSNGGSKITFEIPHFSSYYYDDYDDY
jgi:hypothetical protein